MIRKDLGDNIMEIKHTKGIDRWLVIKKQLDASNVRRQLTITLKVKMYCRFAADKAGNQSLLSLKSLICKWYQGRLQVLVHHTVFIFIYSVFVRNFPFFKFYCRNLSFYTEYDHLRF